MTYGASQWRTGNDLALKQDEERHVTEQDMAVSTDTNSRQTGVSRRTVYIYIYIYKHRRFGEICYLHLHCKLASKCRHDVKPTYWSASTNVYGVGIQMQ